jgi:predicted lipoprotein with Yx(FWY)xxD motif
MNTSPLRVAASATALLAVTALAGCGSDANAPASSTSSSPSSASSSSSSSAAGPDLAVAKTSLGQVVVNGSQMTVSVFTKDKPGSGKSSCSGQCLAAWPPVTTTADTPTVDGVTGTVGTITGSDGSKQVTLNGSPLYLFAKDSKPGDVTGQGVGKVWYVVGPTGDMVVGGSSGGY